MRQEDRNKFIWRTSQFVLFFTCQQHEGRWEANNTRHVWERSEWNSGRELWWKHVTSGTRHRCYPISTPESI